MSNNYLKATFAGGCFWCMVKPFDQLEGIISITSGYTGGISENPTYEEVCSNKTGHLEAVQIIYNPLLISYNELLEMYWPLIDPTDDVGQFHDRGESYKTAIFYHTKEQKELAELSKKKIEDSKLFKKPIVTEIREAEVFYDAEDYHQDFYKKDPNHYRRYREGSGRDAFIKNNWFKQLTPMQLHVTKENGTEPPFENEYWDNKEDGIFVDIISGKPLFSSLDQYDAGCGWPSFTKPIETSEVLEKVDKSHGMNRVEVRSKTADSHLGHVFLDGPSEKGGLRYCINSAALKFIKKKDLEKEGYKEYLNLFN